MIRANRFARIALRIARATIWWTCRRFFIFCSGGGKGGVRATGRGGGGGFLLKIPEGGGFPPGWGGSGRGCREGVCREFGGFWGGAGG